MSSKKIAENLQATYIKNTKSCSGRPAKLDQQGHLLPHLTTWLCSLVPTWWKKRASKIVHYLYSYAVIQTHTEEKKKEPTNLVHGI